MGNRLSFPDRGCELPEDDCLYRDKMKQGLFQTGETYVKMQKSVTYMPQFTSNLGFQFLS